MCTLLASASIAACQTAATGLGLPDQLVDGITYRVTGFNIAESFPVQLGITVELENESATQRSVTFPDGCVVLIRAYDGGTLKFRLHSPLALKIMGHKCCLFSDYAHVRRFKAL